MRWHDPRRGLVSPVQFIPEAEASGLIVPLGNWVLEEAATTLHRWQNDPALRRVGHEADDGRERERPSVP